jgi:hypothetical protein
LVRAKTNAYQNGRCLKDHKYTINSRVQAAVHQCLKRRGRKKIGKTETIIGYSFDALEKRLQATMPPGYTWNDFLLDRPHIDHIIPLRAFNFTPEKDYDFKLGWALSNLRSLPGPDNWAKSGKLAAPFQPNLAFGGQSASNSVAHAGRFNLRAC